MKIHQLQTGRIHEGDWMEADLAPGYTLAIIDGPYALSMAAWDKMKLDDLAEWYRPHLARVSELLAPSASVYLWNTAAGWARIDPVMRGLGWTLKTAIVWNKRRSIAIVNPAVVWADVTELAGFYVRGSPFGKKCADEQTNVWTTDLTTTDREMLRGEEEVRSECVTRSKLHPAQKPVEWAERMIRASTRPGDRILSPFGGTCREAVICEWIARTTPEDARGFDCCELNQDGKDYIGPVLRQIAGEDTRPGRKEQVSLFPTPR